MFLGESCGPSVILVHFDVHLDVNSTCACVCEFGPASNGNSSRPSVWEGAQVATKLHAAAQAHIYCNPSIMTFAEIVDVFKKNTFQEDVYMPSVREGTPGLPKLHAAAQGILVLV